MQKTRRLIVAGVAVLASLAAAGPAAAHQSPAGCNTSAAHVDLTGGTNVVHRNGDDISVIAKVSNNAPGACDVTDARLTMTFPNPDGSPGTEEQVIATGIDLPAGTTPKALPEVHHTVNFDPGVFRGPVKASLYGTFHWVGTHTPDAFQGSLEVPLVVTHPHATIDVTPTQSLGQVTYKYAVKNDSPHDPNPGAADPNIFNIGLTDDRCGPIPATHTGDTNMNDVMEPGETWTYQCTTTLPSGTFTNHVTLDATSTRDGRPWPKATGQSTVTVDGADMTLQKSHAGDFTQGDKGRTYSLVAKNSGNMPSSGAVSVADTLPAGLTATDIAGDGWTCTVATLSCTRSDALAAGASYPKITVTVDVADDAPASVTNTAKVSHPGEDTSNDEASDPTAIAEPQPEQPGPGTGGEQPGGEQPGGETPSGDAPRDQGPSGDGPTGNDTPPRDVTAPAFAALRMTNRTFTVNPKGAAQAARARKGTAFLYTLSEPARVTVAIERKAAGRRSGADCVKETKRNRRGRSCTRWLPAGSFTQDGTAGANSKGWAGKVGSRALKPGAYRASVVATDAAGNKSAARRLSFRIVRR
jgi:uncharacterized repeat protein (TIGR01451 family)